jgi:Ca-activated chloride channel family protein
VPFTRPWLLALLLLVPLWLWWRRRRVPLVAASALAVPVQAKRRSWWPAVPIALRALAYAAWITAAAGPTFGGRELELRGEGIAIALAIDVSSSMLAEDFAPSNRLEVAKRQAIRLRAGKAHRPDRARHLRGRGAHPGAAHARLRNPGAVDRVAPGRCARRWHGDRHRARDALNRLKPVPGKSKVVLLLTDGENNRGAVDPRTAAEAAAALGVKVYTIGVGTEGEARVPTGRGLSGLRYEVVPVRIDEVLLREIAAKTGGRYFRATDAAALERIFRQIDALERTKQEQTMYSNRDEVARPFLLVGLGLLALELLLGATLVVRVP